MNNLSEYQKNIFNQIRRTRVESEFKKKHLSEENFAKIRALKDKYSGKRCFIVGGSPSLKQLDLTKLNNEIVFTVNRGYKLKEQGLLKSTFHIMADAKTFIEDDIMQELPDDFTKTYLIYAGIDFVETGKDVIYFDYIRYLTTKNLEKYFEKDITKPLIAYDTAIVHALHFANYMNFNEIIIIGVDIDFQNLKGHAYKQTEGEQIRQNKCNEHSINAMFKGIQTAKQYLEEKGVKIYNASPCGKLDCVERVKYEELF